MIEQLPVCAGGDKPALAHFVETFVGAGFIPARKYLKSKK